MLKLSKSEELLQMLRQRAEAMDSGERFPSVRELMKEYNVSQFTVAPAMTQLEELGLIRREVGRGTFVQHNNKAALRKLALLCPEWPSSAIQDMAKAIEIAGAPRGWKIQKTFYDIASDIFARLEKIDADAIILDPPNPGEITPKQLEILSRINIPVVLIRSDIPFAGVNCVCGNNSAAGIIAADYLIRNGHRKLGVLFSEPHVHTGVELIESFCHAAGNMGAEITMIDCQTNPGEDSMQSAYVKMREWLPNNTLNFSALFVSSDETVLGAYKALAENDIRVPEQLSVMGFGNASPGAFYHPSLTTIDTDREKMAIAALNIIETCLGDGKHLGHMQKIYPTLVERQSVIKNQNK